MRLNQLSLPYTTGQNLSIRPLFCHFSCFDDPFLGVFSGFWGQKYYTGFLFEKEQGVLPTTVLLYLWASFILDANLRGLSRVIRRISFEETKDPRPEVNEILHKKREELSMERTEVADALRYQPDIWKRYYDGSNISAEPHVKELQRMLDEAEKLDSFLMQTFQLFMSSLAVQDSKMSIQQAQRTTRLTLLALVYIPISFVTGIFGMNIRELNDSGASIWVFFVVVAAAAVLSMSMFWSLRSLENRRAGGKEKESRSEDFEVPLLTSGTFAGRCNNRVVRLLPYDWRMKVYEWMMKANEWRRKANRRGETNPVTSVQRFWPEAAVYGSQD